jgi:hypothetical protein
MQQKPFKINPNIVLQSMFPVSVSFYGSMSGSAELQILILVASWFCPRHVTCCVLHNSDMIFIRSAARSLTRTSPSFLPRVQIKIPIRAAVNQVTNKPGSQTIEHAATNVREEFGNSAADIARSIAGGTLNAETLKPKEWSFVSVRIRPSPNLAQMPSDWDYQSGRFRRAYSLFVVGPCRRD